MTTKTRPQMYRTRPAPSHETAYCGACVGRYRITAMIDPALHDEFPNAVTASARLQCGHLVRIVRRGRL